MQINPLIKKRGHTSPIILLESFHLREKLTILKRRGVLKSKEKPRKIKNLFPGKILINKTRLKFWGVTTLPPLRKNLVLEIC